MNNLYYANEITENSGDITGRTTFNNFMPEPYLGYSHKFNPKLWIGIDLGYNKYSVKRTSNTEIGINISNRSSTYDFEMFYLSVSTEEFFSFKKYYQYSLGLAVPFSYFTKRVDEQTSTSINTAQPNNTTEDYSYNKWPQTLRTGLFVQQSISRKIYKGLFFGAKINLGLSIEKRWGEYDVVNWSKQNGTEINRSEYKIKEEKYTEAQFSIFPSFYFNYFIN